MQSRCGWLGQVKGHVYNRVYRRIKDSHWMGRNRATTEGGLAGRKLIKRVNQVWPADNKFKAANSAGQVYRFINEIVIGDEGRHDSSQD